MTLPKYDHDIDPEWHPSQETRDLRPRDRLLREHGFTIAARPRAGPARWRRAGKLLTEAEALDLCYAEMMRKE